MHTRTHIHTLTLTLSHAHIRAHARVRARARTHIQVHLSFSRGLARQGPASWFFRISDEDLSLPEFGRDGAATKHLEAWLERVKKANGDGSRDVLAPIRTYIHQHTYIH